MSALCCPWYAHEPARAASRAGTVPSEVVLGGRKVAVARPRVRADGREVPLPTFQTLAHEDPLKRRVVDQMLVGVATRQYARSLEPVPAGVVSRRFVAKTAAQLRVWQPAPLGELDYPLHDWASTVTRCGRICFRRRKVNLSVVCAGQLVGVRQVDEHLWLVTFMHYDLGYFDDETRLEPIENPFGPTVLPVSPE